MQDLTFGEQVKIILSRKDMTIKELARKIERRTGKKMSRQNLTQRLGRDNFQEQDMRMIAEILECPFYLNILDDGILMERDGREMEGQETKELTGEAKQAENTKLEEHSEETEKNRTEDSEPQKYTEEGAAAKGTEEQSHSEEGTAVKEAEEKSQSEEGMAAKDAEEENRSEEGTAAKDAEEESQSEEEAAGSVRSMGQPESGESETHSGHTSDGKANERDITIGELVDIHKKLDVLENSAGNLSAMEEGTAESRQSEYGENPAQTGMMQGEISAEQAQDTAWGYQETQDYQESVEFQEEYAQEMGKEPVENILKEIESLEKPERKEEVKQEEKPRGWRAYFKKRFKKFKDQTVVREEMPGSEAQQSQTAAGMQGIPQERTETGYTEGGYTGTSYTESGYTESGYTESGYSEINDTETGYGETYDTEASDMHSRDIEAGYGGAYQGDYPQGSYEQADYAGAYAQGHEEIEYGEMDYEAAGYRENGDSDTGYGESGYVEDEYIGDVQEEAVPEEDIEQGEINPYTGKEYESNSVRMHPSRIGYVQVYDRENHQWTDMTEWAFLGYQERKKQLLGKAYDPPIYLD